MRWIYIGAAVVFAAAAVSVFVAFQRTDFFAGLTAIAVGALLKAIFPFFKPGKFTDKQKDRIKSGHPPFGRDR